MAQMNKYIIFAGILAVLIFVSGCAVTVTESGIITPDLSIEKTCAGETGKWHDSCAAMVAIYDWKAELCGQVNDSNLSKECSLIITKCTFKKRWYQETVSTSFSTTAQFAECEKLCTADKLFSEFRAAGQYRVGDKKIFLMSCQCSDSDAKSILDQY